jgi:hypothetical protein
MQVMLREFLQSAIKFEMGCNGLVTHYATKH